MKNHISICYLIDHLGQGGAQKRIFHTIPLLSDAYRPRVFSLHEGSASAREIGLTIRDFEALGRHRYDPKIISGILRISREPCDIVHTHLYYSFLAGCLVRKVSPGIRLIAHINHMRDSMPRHVFETYSFLQGMCDLFIAINESVKHDLCRSGVKESRITVGTIAVDKERFSATPGRKLLEELKLKADDFIILRTARLSEEKSNREFLHVFRQVRDKVPEAKLLIAGDGPERLKLQGMIEHMGLASSVLLLGSRDDIPELNAMAHLAFVRGFGTECLEHLAAGVPVISFDSDGAAEIIRHGENGYVFPFREAAQMAEAVITLAKDREKLVLLKTNCSRTVDGRFTYSREAQIWDNAYRSLLQGLS
jgi:glycosyltransferase involved in cell wall biosynthesis